MCGIGGIVGSEHAHRLIDVTTGIRAALMHRGPDDQGAFIDPVDRVALIHTRLSVIDLSPAGHQPLQIDGGRYTIVFNGEIYNFNELRRELTHKGVVFQSHTDTEVILRLYQQEGVACVERLKGMYAFGIWDAVTRSCFLARDPLGIKPLYLWRVGEILAFASEVRALLATNLAAPQIDPLAIARYLLFGSVQEPDSLIQGIEQLPAGHRMLWRNGRGDSEPFWSLDYSPRQISSETAIADTRKALDETIRRHFVSDVPVGIFLSGGIDSNALLALAKANGFGDLQTFSVSFDEAEFNEGDLARRSAVHFSVKHHDWRMTATDGHAVLSEFLASLDLPSNDGFNTYCVSKFARDCGLKVVLSGLGGDELFGGYPSFTRVPALMRLYRGLKCPRVFSYVAGVAGRLPIVSPAKRIKLHRVNRFLSSDGSSMAAFWAMRSFFSPEEAGLLVAHLTGQSLAQTIGRFLEAEVPCLPSAKDVVGYIETTRYMRNQLLRDSDVTSMAHGLELRVPFVDSALLEVVNRIPSNVRCAPGKRLLLDAVPEVPEWIRNSPKRGFRFPFEHWAKKEWKDEFDFIETTSPVPLVTWYRKWAWFALQRFLSKTGLASVPCG